jgi:hypothetical protein
MSLTIACIVGNILLRRKVLPAFRGWVYEVEVKKQNRVRFKLACRHWVYQQLGKCFSIWQVFTKTAVGKKRRISMLRSRFIFRSLATAFNNWCIFMSVRRILWQRASVHWSLHNLASYKRKVCNFFLKWAHFVQLNKTKSRKNRKALLFHYDTLIYRTLEHWKSYVKGCHMNTDKTRIALVHRYHHILTSHFYFWRYWSACNRTKRNNTNFIHVTAKIPTLLPGSPKLSRAFKKTSVMSVETDYITRKQKNRRDASELETNVDVNNDESVSSFLRALRSTIDSVDTAKHQSTYAPPYLDSENELRELKTNVLENDYRFPNLD